MREKDSLVDTLAKRQEVCRPPVPATTDWVQARRSVQLLAGLRPKVIAAGHGKPMSGAADELQHLADHFPVPEHGRYAHEAASGRERNNLSTTRRLILYQSLQPALQQPW